MQLRRLDPLANAGPYQKLTRSPVKSFSLAEDQFDRLKERRPELIVTGDEGTVVARPYRDCLEVHYAYPDVEAFRERFQDMFETAVAGFGRQEAPRGVLISFRDRPNRPVADQIFWFLALEQGRQWVEMSLVAVPEQPEPGDSLTDAYTVRDVTDADCETIGAIDGEAMGAPPLTRAGVQSLREDAKLTRVIVRKGAGEAAGYLCLRTEPGGWGVIEALALKPSAAPELQRPALDWSIAWLRNNGGRRVRMRVAIDDKAILTALKDAGFAPGETGIDFTRSADLDEVKAKLGERKAHGTIIKFGDWR